MVDRIDQCDPDATTIRRGLVDGPQEHWADMSGSPANSRRAKPGATAHPLDECPLLQLAARVGRAFMGPMPEPPHRQPRMHNVLPEFALFIYHSSGRARRAGVEIVSGGRHRAGRRGRRVSRQSTFWRAIAHNASTPAARACSRRGFTNGPT